MSIQIDFTNMMADVVGEHGISEADLEGLREKTGEIHRDLMERRERGLASFYDLPFDKDQVEKVRTFADEAKGRYENVVVLGIGGSALGTIALSRALLPLYHNHTDSGQSGGHPRLFVVDNVDPSGFGETLDYLDPGKTLVIVISKSGSTVETMCQFMISRDWMEEAVGDSYRDHFVLITDPSSGALRKLAEDEGYASFDIPEKVGGRFSVFTPVGLLPLALAGVDVEAVLEGAAAMESRVTLPGLMENPAYLNAALNYLAYRKGLKIGVLMPYSDRLYDFADWYRQIWAESLGKKFSRGGDVVHTGPTPIKALGTTDQHSQVQLYMEGPFDKLVTFISVEDYGRDLKIPKKAPAPGLSYLSGHSMAELIRIEQQATAVALSKNGRPNCTIKLDRVSPGNMGALIYMFEVQTVFAGGLFDVNPLDQPGVEEGKEFTYALMGREGFEEKEKEFSRRAGQHRSRIL
ncbi:MAG: glucose-6-phosphate isomerase [Desulfuromonadales bacterium]